MAVSNKLATLGQKYLPAMIADTVLGSNVVATRFIKKAKKWRGTRELVPVKYKKNNTGGSFSGFDLLDTSATDTRVNMEFEPKYHYKTVALSKTDIAENETEMQKLRLMEVETESAAQDLADDIGTAFYGDGTGNSGKDILGLEALIDDGSNVGTIGGLSRSTYTTLQSTTTASGGTLTIDKLSTLYNNAASGARRPTLSVVDEDTFSLFERLLEVQERYNKGKEDIKSGLTGGTGYLDLYYKGMPVIADEKCTDGTWYMINEDTIDFRTHIDRYPGVEKANLTAGDIEGNDYEGDGKSSVKGMGFGSTPWRSPDNQESMIKFVIFAGNFIINNPRHNAKLTGITSV